MSTARDAGLAALQSGDIQTAITQLEEAVKETPSDYDACLYLGGAYGQANRHLDAIKSFTQAVQLQPANAQARYNLGVAMEQGGYNDQALQVYHQAVQLQPDYPKAQEAVARLHESSNQGFGGPVTSSPSTAGSGQQFQQAQPQPAPTQQFAQPAAFGQQPAVQPTSYNPLAPTPEAIQPTAVFPAYSATGQQPAQPAGYNPLAPNQPPAQTPAFGQPTAQLPVQSGEPGLGSYMAPPPPAARPAYGQSGPGTYGARPGAMPYSSGPSYDDEFKIGQAFKDFFRALFMPRTLFSEMEGCDTSSSTMALYLVYCFFYFLISLIFTFKLASTMGPAVFIAAAIGVGIGCLILLITWAIVAGVVHLLSRAFGSSLNYGASFRCVVYSAAPFIVLCGIGRAIIDVSVSSIPTSTRVPSVSTIAVTPVQYSPGRPGANPFGSPGMRQSNPFGTPGSRQPNQFGSRNGGFTSTQSSPFGNGMPNPLEQYPLAFVLIVVGALWSIGLLGVAATNVHQISGGAGAGVAILTAIIMLALLIGLIVIVSIVGGAALVAMASKMGGGGG